MSQIAKAEQLAQADVIIGPELLNLRTFDFQLQDSLVALGFKAGGKAVQEIRRKIAGSNHKGFRQLDYVMLARNDDWLQYLKQNFPIKPGDYFKPGSLDKALEYADRQMHFNRLTADIQRLDGKTAIVLDGQLNHTTDVIEFKFVGNATLSDSIMLSCFTNNVRGVLSLAKVQKDADSLIRIYKRQGHDLAHIRHIHYDHDAGVVIVVIDEGRLRYVDIRGNERTRDWVIKANYPLRPGAPFDTEQSETGIAQIYGTGFFDRVSLDFQPTDDGVHLTINVKEKKFTQLRLGAHWDDEYQGEMFAEVLDDNVFGAGLQALAHARVSSRRYEYYMSLKADRLSQTLFMARTKFYFSRLRRRLFQANNAPDGYRVEDRLGLSINLGQQIERFGNFYFQYRVEDIKTTLTIPNFENDEVLTVFAIKSAVETFNRFPFPDKGHRQDIAIEFSGKSLGGTYDEYTKLSGSIEEYFPVGKYLNLHPKIAAGISTADLPDIEKFYIGGMYNFFGFRTHQLSGDKLFVFSMQARLRLPYRFYLIGEYDYGNIFDDYENIKIREFRNGWGATIAWDTPLGPFEFGYGKAEQTPDRLYLNLGLRF
jgi:outer membrane protein assembly factor BamA